MEEKPSGTRPYDSIKVMHPDLKPHLERPKPINLRSLIRIRLRNTNSVPDPGLHFFQERSTQNIYNIFKFLPFFRSSLREHSYLNSSSKKKVINDQEIINFFAKYEIVSLGFCPSVIGNAGF
jgi:hypothetical protein